MAKYKVYYTGVAYVEADTREEAEEMYRDDYTFQEECVEHIVELAEDNNGNSN